MAIYIEILTDLRVSELLPSLLLIQDISLRKELDSMNYGEGYELTYHDLELRLYDEVRSDEAQANDDYKSGSISWDKAFEIAVKQHLGNATLSIEIDRLDYKPNLQAELKNILVENLTNQGFTISIE